MSPAPNPPADDTTTPAVAEPRSLAAVLGILGAIVALPLLIVLLVLIVRGTGATGGKDVLDGVDADRIQAVYLSNDRVYFGRVSSTSGDWLTLDDAYYLSQSAESARSGDAASTTDLVPVAREVGGDGSLVINAREVTLLQNLAKGSTIAKELEKATK